MRQPRSFHPPEPSLGSSRRDALAEARLYLCTPSRPDLREFLHAAYEGGVDIIQLRDKGIDARKEIEAVEVLAEVAAEHGKLFSVNDRADVAALVDADIFHVGQGDLTSAQARALLGDDVIIGRSNNSTEMFKDSLNDVHLDYAVIGPVWETPTKPGRKAVGTETIRQAAELTAISDNPWFAIGGIDEERMPEVLRAGAQRVVVVRAITEARDPEEAARLLRSML
ncbi:thiamine phosphate synthase [Corynebacterium sputi]|uniref:thiamine phosphate synthase n=1 Tax=Corynebacterium sputi TaxID=489915 RepID=UPI0004032F9B|nr:thiamine phosphate synthase [Corynebacterium sputi]